MKNLPLLIGTLLGTFALIFGVVFFFSKSSEVTADPTLVQGNMNHVKGNQDSNIVVVEFSDFQCPACAATQPYIDQIYQDYQDKIKFVYRHFPLHSLHPNAQLAAQAAEVAAEEGKFWEYHDLLFANQSDWENLSGDELLEKFSAYAQQLQIDKTLFSERIESDQIKQRVQSDEQAALQLGLNSTPTFFVNDRKVPAPEIRSTIDSLLTNE